MYTRGNSGLTKARADITYVPSGGGTGAAFIKQDSVTPPEIGSMKLYFKIDDKLYGMDSSGQEYKYTPMSYDSDFGCYLTQ